VLNDKERDEGLMKIETKEQILEILNMDYDQYKETVMKEAYDILVAHKKKQIKVTGMLAFNNRCKNQCTYCGMRANNTDLKRYTMPLKESIAIEKTFESVGINRIFFISGDDPNYFFNDLKIMVEEASKMGLYTMMGVGERSYEEFLELKEAGLDEYALKFETANPILFEKIKPRKTLEKRLASIDDLKKSGLRLGSGDIVDFPGQTLDNLAEDILLTKKLEIHWAPIIPYMPVPGTPLAKEGPRGSVEIMQKVISILRIMLPDVDLTAQQPGKDLSKGLGDYDANRDAIKAGANLLFVDMTPKEEQENFRVIEHRVLNEMKTVERIIESMGMVQK
jgi:biotin synthase